MRRASKLTPKGAKIVASPERFRGAIGAGAPIGQIDTARRVKLDPKPVAFGPAEVKGIRAMMGVSRPIFGRFRGGRRQDGPIVGAWESACLS